MSKMATITICTSYNLSMIRRVVLTDEICRIGRRAGIGEVLSKVALAG
jgi:hypothetical protein